ncbi:hypothetical protein [Pendulispora albinea]|uniref:Uncharacterized protein n=1 Tax=Pendulispora albinea TaxID=2741071 RepID=A0ABZ2M9K4_9BACT
MPTDPNHEIREQQQKQQQEPSDGATVVRDGAVIAVLWCGMPHASDHAALARELAAIEPGARSAVLLVSTGSMGMPTEEQRVVMRALRGLTNGRDLALFAVLLAKGIAATVLRALLPRNGELKLPDGSGRSMHVYKTAEAALEAMDQSGFDSPRIRDAVLAWSAASRGRRRTVS